MWIMIKNTSINIANDKINYSFFVSDDINALTVKVGGTQQTFNKKENENFIDLTVPIKVSKGISTQIICDENLILELFSAPYGKDDITGITMELIEFKNQELMPALEIIEIKSKEVLKEIDTMEKIIEIDSIYKSTEIKISSEYDRGLSDGLVLGQMI